MKYIINPSAWTSMFAVPTDVVDKHLRLAGAVQLKVLLWLLRHAADNSTAEKMAEDLGISVPDVADAMFYWIDAGIVVENENEINFVKASENKREEPEKAETPTKTEPKKVLPEIRTFKPTVEQIVLRGEESEEVRFMFTEAQIMLGRTIGHDGQATLLMMHDNYGLPVEVIMMIIEYCISVGKSSTAYIAKIGKDWGEKEIDTIEKADSVILSLRASNELWKEFRNRAGFTNPKPTSSQVKYLSTWKNEYGYDIEMIYLAYEEMANNTQKLSFPYMDKVLQNWHKDGLKTPSDVERAKSERKTRTKIETSKKEKEKRKPSYDLEEFMKKNEERDLIYKKKGG